MTNVIKTGSATPWREVPGARMNDEDAAYVYLCDGHQTGNAGLLAEALRADGVIRTLYWSIRAAEEARLVRSFYGYMDGEDGEIFCDPNGDTPHGDVVDEPRPCVIAFVYDLEE